jgi:hypothetical protein
MCKAYFKEVRKIFQTCFICFDIGHDMFIYN